MHTHTTTTQVYLVMLMSQSRIMLQVGMMLSFHDTPVHEVAPGVP